MPLFRFVAGITCWHILLSLFRPSVLKLERKHRFYGESQASEESKGSSSSGVQSDS
jgi:hypothetical protein